MIPRIYYDKTCPVCSNYIKLVQRKVEQQAEKAGKKVGELVEYYQSEAGASEFKFIDENGKEYSGSDAIEAMAKVFPSVKDYMFMLPQKYKVSGLKAAYKVGSVVRKAYGAVKKGCNCGKH